MAAGGPRGRARPQAADKRLSQESGVSPRERPSESDPARAARHSPGCLALCVYQGARTVESGVVFIVPQLSFSWRGTPGHSFSSAALGGGCAVGVTPSREEHDSLGSKTRDTGSME